jgi:hypothetical protein
MVDGTRRRDVVRPAFGHLLRWCQEPPDVPPGHRVKGLSDDDLLRGLCHAWTERCGHHRPTLETLESYTALAREWISRYVGRPEMELGYGLISLLLLETCLDWGPDLLAGNARTSTAAREFLGEWRRLASGLMRDLGQRALRSAHVEVIAREWLGRHSDEPPSSLRRRLVAPAEHLGPAVRRDVFRALEHFCHAVELRESLAPHAAQQPLAAALRRAMGQAERTNALVQQAPITRELVDLYAVSMWSRAQRGPLPLVAHLQRLRKVLDNVMAGGLDITLLDPLTGPVLQVVTRPPGP